MLSSRIFFVLFIGNFVMSTSWSEHLRRHARGVLVLAPAPVRDWRLGPCTCANATHIVTGFVMPLTSWSRHLRQRAQASWSRHLRYMTYCDHELLSPIAVQLQYSAPIGGRYCWGVVVHGARCDYIHDCQWPSHDTDCVSTHPAVCAPGHSTATCHVFVLS